MNLSLNGISALKAIRVRREERLAILRSQHAQKCEHIKQAMREASQRSEQAALSLKQRKQARWSDVYSRDFDSRTIMRAYQADREDVQSMAQSDAVRRELQLRLDEAHAALAQLAVEHVQCVRRLEACKELQTWQGRQQTRRATAREEAMAEALQGARHGR